MARKKFFKAAVLVGHGGVPRDCPPEWVSRLKALESARRKTGAPRTGEEQELDRALRAWPRSKETDPYRAGMERLAARLAPRLHPVRLAVAYNEFCAPTLEDACGDLVKNGAGEIVVVPTMFTPGGIHSEREIPDKLAALRTRFPEVRFHYAWPFDLDRVAAMLADQVFGSGRDAVGEATPSTPGDPGLARG